MGRNMLRRWNIGDGIVTDGARGRSGRLGVSRVSAWHVMEIGSEKPNLFGQAGFRA